MIGRFIRDESGITMPLAIITMVLVGVMGAGLLAFVATDLTNVAETNRGQKALEVADAGIQAARQRLVENPGDTSNMTVTFGSDSTQVTITNTGGSPATYRVVSSAEVGSGDRFARRKVEATFVREADLNIPRTFLTQSNLTLTGSGTPSGISFFALGDVRKEGGSFTLGEEKDKYYGKWAETNDAFSYPNDNNRTPRIEEKSGIGALGSIITTGGTGDVREGFRSYDSTPINATTPKVVRNYDGSTLDAKDKIAFPFKITSKAEDKEQIEALRQQALDLEDKYPANEYYMDSVPGNGEDDPGRSAGSISINSWYDNDEEGHSAVRFYEYESYSTSNMVTYASSPIPNCDSTDPPKGVIVVQNGDFTMNGNRVFNGAIVVRAYDSAGNVLSPPAPTADVPAPLRNGSFTGEGSACLKGYANSSSNMRIAGGIKPGSVPELEDLDAFKGEVQMTSWRELY